MDRVAFVAMTGAKEMFQRQATVSNNLANASTQGYRAQTVAFRSLPVFGPGYSTRAYAVDSTVASDFTPGPVIATDRDLDVAVQGKGWLAVQDAQGREAYTRAGSLHINGNGQLQTRTGLPLVGEGGPLSIPPDNEVTIADDGTVSVIVPGTPAQLTNLGRLKLVDPPDNNLQRGDDGLFRTKDGQPAAADPNVRIASRALEQSNVNVVESLVQMISAARQFETQLKMIQTADQNARSASQILSVAG